MGEKIQRQLQKIFGSNASTDSLAVFGSMITGNPVYTDNLEDLQSTAYTQGWEAAIAANEAPFMEEMNGVQYGLSKQIAYILQTGIAEWDEGTEYFANTSFCQVNGIIFQSITDHNIGNNPIEDTTNWKKIEFGSENDTIPLFTGMYFDFKPNNASWLKAGTQQNSGGIYTSCYNTLVNCLTPANNIYNLKVIETSAMIAGVDYSEYWKVNQDEMYFITPTKISYLPINGDTAPVVGNGMTLGATNFNGMLGGLRGTNGNSPAFSTGAYGKQVTDVFVEGTILTGNKNMGITTDPTKSGMIADLSSAKSTTAQLYFKVANAVQNLELLDAGQVLEALANKQDTCIHIVETYQNGTSWYRVWSDGWCEQGGEVNMKANTTTTITFLKPFMNTNYGANANRVNGGATNIYGGINGITKTSGAQMDLINMGDSQTVFAWLAWGSVSTSDINPNPGGGGSMTIDTALSPTSTNPVQNKAIYQGIQNSLGTVETSLDTIIEGGA